MTAFKNKMSGILESESSDLTFLPLTMLSVLYGGIVRLRNLCYDRRLVKIKKPGCDVVSVGNITIGGTGKTPMVVLLASMLKKKGYRPAILSRGYGGKKRRPITVVSDGENILVSQEEAGDEPILMARMLPGVPIVAGKKRSLTGSFTERHFNVDVLILDDGFQHRSLNRSVDIVLLDVEKPFGNGYMLPRGRLRESTDSLHRADIVVFTGSRGTENPGVGSSVEWGVGEKPVFHAWRHPQHLVKGMSDDAYPLEFLEGKRVCAFSGIARPEQFRRTVESVCDNLAAFIDFPDHYRYKASDIEMIRRACTDVSADLILTTEKDGVRLITFPEFLATLYQLRIQMEIAVSSAEFENTVVEKLAL